MAHDSPTAEELLTRYRESRQPRDLAALFDLAAPDLFRLALHLVPDAATAEDVLQETFLAVMEHADAYEPGRPALPWLGGVLRNHAGMARRRERRRPDPDRAPRPAPPDDPAALAEGAEERERVQAALQALPEPYRGVALLRWRYGLEPAEIADVRGVPPGTVWSLLSRALQRLKVELGALPALMAMALRPERGLGGVRRALLRRAAAKGAGAAAGTGAAAAAATGGVLMAGKAAACAAVVLLGAAGWFAFRDGGAPSAPIVSPDDTLGKAPPPPAAVAEKEPAPAAPEPPSLPPPVDLSTCDRALDLFGTVVDGKGAAVAGATISTVIRPWRRLSGPGLPPWDEWRDGLSIRSASDGTFRFRLGPHEVVDLRIVARGFADTLLPDCPAGERLRVVLVEGASLQVTARDAAGRPVAGARVRLFRKPSGLVPIYDRRGVTDAEGRCALPGLSPGRALLTAEHDRLGSPRAQIPLIPGEGEIALEMVLPDARAVAGRITDAASGEGIPGGRVGAGPWLEGAVLADAEGGYVFPRWPAGEDASLYAEAPGHARMSVTVPATGGVDFPLAPSVPVVGRLLGDGERPLSGVPLILFGSDGGRGRGSQADMLSATSGGDGRFTLEGAHLTWRQCLVVAAEGYGRLVLDLPPRDGASGPRDLGDIHLPPARRIAGTLVDGNGIPIPWQEVAAFATSDADDDPVFIPERRRTDDLGRFDIAGLSAGPYRLEARVEGQPPIRAEVTLPPDRDLLDVRLGAPAGTAAGGPLRVRVVDPAGAPVPGIYVWCLVEGMEGIQRTTDRDGWAEFKDVAATKAKVQIAIGRLKGTAPRFLQPAAPVETAIPNVDLVVHLQEAAAIRGRVLGPDGQPLPGMWVRGDAGEGNQASDHSGADGGFTLSVEGGVSWKVSVPGFRLKEGEGPQSGTEPSPYRADPQEVTAPADGLVFAMREVRSGMTLTVRVVDLEGRGVAGCYITQPRVPGSTDFPMTDAEGRAVLAGLMEEETRVLTQEPTGIAGKSSLPEQCVMPEPVSVVPAGQEVVLRLRRGEPVSGRVIDGEGRPVEGAWVHVQTEDFILAQAMSGPDGRFTAWISPGRKRLMAAASKSIPGTQTMEQGVLQGPDLPREGEIEIRLKPVPPR